jgi:hypothetical protein
MLNFLHLAGPVGAVVRHAKDPCGPSPSYYVSHWYPKPMFLTLMVDPMPPLAPKELFPVAAPVFVVRRNTVKPDALRNAIELSDSRNPGRAISPRRQRLPRLPKMTRSVLR